jgi:hypothetical protein
LGPGEQAQSLGALLARWLARRFVEGLRARRFRVPRGLHAAAEGRAAEVPWLRLACEAAALDCRWGPACTWRRLRRAAWEAVPELGRIPIDLPAAQRSLVRAVADYAQQACLSLVRLGAGEGPGGLAVLGPLSGSPVFRGVLRSILASAGFEAEFAAGPWVAWLAPAEAEAAPPFLPAPLEGATCGIAP